MYESLFLKLFSPHTADRKRAEAIASLLASLEKCRDDAPDVFSAISEYEEQLKRLLRYAMSGLPDGSCGFIVAATILPVEQARARRRMGRRRLAAHEKGRSISKACQYINAM